MKVDVRIIKKPGVKVDITLARGNRHGRHICIPVRVAPYLAVDPVDCDEYELYDSQIDPVEQPEDEVSDGEYTEEYDSEEWDAEEEFELCDDQEDILPEAAEEIDPDEEELLRLIAEEEAEMAASQQKSEEAPAEPPAPSHYMSYLDRTDSGEVFEVDDHHAAGQKIVCMDSESGRISRVCGFIKNNQSADDEAATSEADGEPAEAELADAEPADQTAEQE